MEEPQHIKITDLFSKALIGNLDITDVDWNNPDVIRLFEHVKSRIEKVEKDNEQMQKDYQNLQKENEQMQKDSMQMQKDYQNLQKENEQTQKENEQLRALLGLQSTSVRSGPADGATPKESRKRSNFRSYNVRNLNGYPRPESAAPKKTPKTNAVARACTADAVFCPKCSKRLSDWSEEYTRISEDLVENKWTKTQWTVTKRYCKSCKKKITATVPGVLPGELYGTNVMAIAAFLRCLCLSYEKIQNILHTLHGAYISEATLIRLCDVPAMKMTPVYDDILEEIRRSESVGGDETGWFLNGAGHWVWTLVTKFSAFYHIAPSRSGDVLDSLMASFDGIVVSDSFPPWNRIGCKHQKCLLHYFRDMYLTLDKNDSAEYSTMFYKLRSILKDAIEMGKATPEEVQCLDYRVLELVSSMYKDKDCIRYTKRLKREADHLFTFLEHNVNYHNNDSERAVRMLSMMRKILYGSRSERGMRTTEILCTVYATCSLRGVNFYSFVKDYLDGKVAKIPMPAQPVCATVA